MVAAALLLALDWEERQSLQAVVHTGLKKSRAALAGLTGCMDWLPGEEGEERCLPRACHSAVAVLLVLAHTCWTAELQQVVHCKAKQFAAQRWAPD